MSLANYVESMCNIELNNLAKNRWIDEFMQVKIYEQGYRVANSYLAENPMLCDSVKEMLWNDGTKRSYVLKATLVINRHYENNISKYEELYSDHKKKFQSSYMGRWRLSSCFLRDAGLRAPVHIVDDITNWILDDKEINSSYEGNRLAKDVINHPNLSVDSCVKMTTYPRDQIRKWAFERLVEINRENKKSA